MLHASFPGALGNLEDERKLVVGVVLDVAGEVEVLAVLEREIAGLAEVQALDLLQDGALGGVHLVVLGLAPVVLALEPILASAGDDVVVVGPRSRAGGGAVVGIVARERLAAVVEGVGPSVGSADVVEAAVGGFAAGGPGLRAVAAARRRATLVGRHGHFVVGDRPPRRAGGGHAGILVVVVEHRVREVVVAAARARPRRGCAATRRQGRAASPARGRRRISHARGDARAGPATESRSAAARGANRARARDEPQHHYRAVDVVVTQGTRRPLWPQAG